MTPPSPAPDASDALELLPSLLADSPALRARLEERFATLIDIVFDELEETLEIGAPSDKQATLKMILPLIVRVKRENETTGEDVEAARTELQRTLAEMGQGLGQVEQLEGPVEVEGSTI